MKRNVLWMLFVTLPLWFFLVSCGGESSENDDNTGDTDEDGIVVDDGVTPDGSDGLPIPDDSDIKDDAPVNPDDGEVLPDDIDTPDDNDVLPDSDIDPTADSDGDGISNSVEAPSGLALDTDSDGTPDYLDTDSDGDTVPDALEGTGDADSDGKSNYRDTDADNDMMNDGDEAGADPTTPLDSDADTIPDYLDNDSDGDGILDIYEGSGDVDTDGTPNYLDGDCDGDDISDAIEAGANPATPADTDGDGIYDFKDGDSDNDGLSDLKEKELGTDPLDEDSDDDLVSDMAEVAYGSNPLDGGSSIPAEDFYVVLPYQEAPKNDDLQFTTDVGIADVVIMIDLSPSMNDEINNLKSNMSSVIQNILIAIPDTHFGLVSFGTWEDSPYTVSQLVTDNSLDVQIALNALTNTEGWYEPQEETLYQAATGDGLTAQIRLKKTRGTPTYSYDDIAIPAVSGCAAGTYGGVCFRDDALPIFLMVTDEPFQGYELPSVPDDYYTGGIDGSWYVGTGHSLTQAIAAMNAKNAKFIGIDSAADILTGPDSYYTQVADGTGSENTAGEAFIYKINPDGTVPGGGDLSAQVVDAVTELTSTIALALSTGTESTTNIYGVAETKDFIKAIDFLSADPVDGVQEVGGELMVDPGTQVTYNVTFRNDFYDNQDPEAHLFTAKILVIGGSATLDIRDVYIIVPGKIPNSGEE